jgi:hypothetical protein
MARSHNRQLDAPAIKEPVGCDEEGIGSVAQESGEGRLDLAASARVEDLKAVRAVWP